MTVRLVDYFAGGGGSSTGAALAGANVIYAANHNPHAVAVHAANHPHTEHACVDITSLAPGATPYAEMAWFSPVCVHHSRSRGRYSESDAAKASRATMWEVIKFSEWHQYPIVIVENVVEVVNWAAWPAWQAAMAAIGYHLSVASVNSTHAAATGPGVGQSRDRLYVTATHGPSLDLQTLLHPPSWCPGCEKTVTPWRAWSNTAQIGKHRSGYRFACPHCMQHVAPRHVPASTVIDWGVPSRAVDGAGLAPNTMRRINIGRARYGDDPFIAELRGGSSTARPVTEPLATVTAGGQHHMLITHPGSEPHYRMLTVPELARAQGFPDSYAWFGTLAEQRSAIGNAVATNVARDLISASRAALN